jgi:hypothetical protein
MFEIPGTARTPAPRRRRGRALAAVLAVGLVAPSLAAAAASGTAGAAISQPVVARLPAPPLTASTLGFVPGPVTCTAAGACVAVGQNEKKNKAEEIAVDTLSDGTWTSTGVPLPPSAVPITSTLVTDVSCAVAGACIAVGSFDTGSDAAGNLRVSGFVATEFGGTWSPAKLLPAPPGASPSLGYWATAVSCVAPAACRIVGNYGLSFGVSSFVDSWTLGSSAKPSVTVVGAPPGYDWLTLASIACTSAEGCQAAGTMQTAAGSQLAVDAGFSGAGWTRFTVLKNPSQAGEQALDSISCTGPTTCTAVGTYDTVQPGIGVTQLVDAYSLVAGRWGRAADLSIPGVKTAGAVASRITCTAAPATCTVIGDYFTPSTVAERHVIAQSTNGVWRSFTPVPVGIPAGSQWGLSGVACVSGPTCEAVGTVAAAHGAPVPEAIQWGKPPVVVTPPPPSPSARATRVRSLSSQLLSLSQFPAGWVVDSDATGFSDFALGCIDVNPILHAKGNKTAGVAYEDGILPLLGELLVSTKSPTATMSRVIAAIDACPKFSGTLDYGKATGTAAAIPFPKLGSQSAAFAISITLDGITANGDFAMVRKNSTVMQISLLAYTANTAALVKYAKLALARVA